ncbi:sensor domain-containing diguanylate cyclase [Rhizobium sp. P28RR-XV]|uniref:GGDEF domain-containing protein n=1 Tax=Rhizobium sp. P28RR-XV TaxID=2726737 RepID=UPI001456485B|nr:GGDEF domain-containing protein [Rhizobium sp. P28RR-XV]NLR85479.1 GGDEF domain-containing protein [Rhizobium sp. P28RR-XV]
MVTSHSTIAMSLIAPGTLFVFGCVFCSAWLVERRRHYLLPLALACVLFSGGALVQVLHLPDAPYPNAMISGVFYTSAVIAATEGILRRSQKRFGLAMDIVLLATFTGLLWYFCYVTPNLIARICVQNFGYGAILVVASLRIAPQSNARRIDRTLFWIMFIFAVQFFPRTALTVGPNAVFSATTFGQSPFWQALQVSVAIMGVILAFAILAAAFSDLLDDLRQERDVDILTKVLNRRGFEERSEILFRRVSKIPLSLVLCDLDHFKSINDTYGHQSGDDVLRRFGQMLINEVRGSDLVGRIGGEEFAVLMPDTSEAEAVAIAERIRSAAENNLHQVLPVKRATTASFGVIERRAGENLRQMMGRADKLLYTAKSAGRNRVARENFSATVDESNLEDPVRERLSARVATH